ncbi:inorganic phosphate transporter [Rhizobium sp. SSA_523]|uniref:inorganic phosphate transporter n=1 Tax=Rhizobium sp. SSA_523 TaxID=2952477 RepID=UPI00208FFC1B|nr:inorganic phosphate transporter [Rhizobium sp. SSA_523]MCO5733159.1 inorganic phosphate transporter [Rhizobium sp. SSA_523]WKC24031.1 inorganic phosphate transporter [Rhizobium sp. SSA_523]
MKARRKDTLDKDLEKITYVEYASLSISRRIAVPGLACLFLIAVILVASLSQLGQPALGVVVIASVLAAYMAVNIGANDVANNIGAAVGARAFSLTLGLAIAAVCEISGALVAGHSVVNTIASGIVDLSQLQGPQQIVWMMMGALLSAALWVNIATWIGAPISTTHSIVGGVMGAGIAAAGMASVNWSMLAGIALSWVASPLLGAIIAVAVLAFIKTTIIYTADKIAAARRWVPVLIGTMFGAFTTYLAIELSVTPATSGLPLFLLSGMAVGLLSWGLSVPLVRRQSLGLENRNQSLRVLFKLPLIFSAALLSFAHGANDVANAIGPLAAIVSATRGVTAGANVAVPFWELLIGGAGISIGLLLFGPKLIHLVGKEITKLNPMRAYCVALSAAVTVILASSVGMPVSSTHVAVGSIFGVGLFREWYIRNSKRRQAYLRMRAAGELPPAKEDGEANPEEAQRRYLVRRSHLLTILAAWTITVPAAAGLAAILTLIMFRLFI